MLRAGHNHVLHLTINDVANDELVQIRLTQVGITCTHRIGRHFPDIDFFKLRKIKNVEVDRIVEVVTVISDLICQVRDLRLERAHLVFLQAFPHFESQIQSGKFRIRVLEQFNNAQTLAVVLEATVFAHAFRQHFFAGMSERRVAEIMRQSDGLGQILVQAQGPRDGATDRGDLDRVSQSRAQMVPGAVEKNLRLVFQAAKSARMNDAGAITLKFGAIGVTRLGKLPAPRFA